MTVTLGARLTNAQRRNVRHNLKTLRQAKGWTQRELASRIDSSCAHICLVESGGRNASSNFAKDLARAFRVPLFKFIDMKMFAKVYAR